MMFSKRLTLHFTFTMKHDGGLIMWEHFILFKTLLMFINSIAVETLSVIV